MFSVLCREWADLLIQTKHKKILLSKTNYSNFKNYYKIIKNYKNIKNLLELFFKINYKS